MKTIRQEIIDTIEDLVADFLWYDRKEDEDLPRGKIEKAIKDGDITIGEIVECFRRELEENI